MLLHSANKVIVLLSNLASDLLNSAYYLLAFRLDGLFDD